MAREDGHVNYQTLDRVALAGIDQYSLVKTVKVQDDGTLKMTIVDTDGRTADVVVHDGYNGLIVCTPDVSTTGTLGALDAVVTKETHGQGSAIFVVSGTWTGKIIFEASIDNSTWVNLSVVQPGGNITFNGVQNDNQNGSYRVPVVAGYLYIRARMSSYTNGSASIIINMSQPVAHPVVFQLNAANLNAQVVGNVANSATDSGNPVKIGGKYNAANPSLSDGQRCDLQMTQDGRVKTEGRLTDNYGFAVENTPMDEQRVVAPVRLVGAQFSGNTIDSNFWTSTVANSATNTQSGAMVVQASGTNAAGSAILQSTMYARYVGGSSLRYRAVVRLGDSGVANNTRKWGAFDGETGAAGTNTDGAYFKLSGTTLSVCTLKDGTETAVASTNWNVDTVVPTLTSAFTCEIYWTNSKVWFVIAGVLKHVVTASATTWTNKMSLPVRSSNINSGNTTDVTLNVRTATIFRLGELVTQPTSKFQSGTTAGLVCKYGAGNIHQVVISAVSNNAVVTLYDNTAASGTVIWASGAMGAQTIPFSIDLDMTPFSTGLTLVISGAACNVLIVYE